MKKYNIQAKIDSIKGDITKWEERAADGREKLTALVPALPELRFLSQLLEVNDSMASMTIGSMSPIPSSPGGSISLEMASPAVAGGTGTLGKVPGYASPMLAGGRKRP